MNGHHGHIRRPQHRGVLRYWESRSRLVALLVWIAALASLQRLLPALMGLALSLLLLAASGISLRDGIRRTLSISAILTVVCGFFVFFGHERWSAPGHIPIFRDGVVYAVTVFAKALGIFWTALALASCGALAGSLQAARSLGFPRPLALIALVTLRYFPILQEQSQTVQSAARCRGFQASPSLRSWRTTAGMGGNILVRAWRKSDRVSQAMTCRGFTGDFPRLGFRYPGFPDIALSAILILAGMGLLLYDVWM